MFETGPLPTITDPEIYGFTDASEQAAYYKASTQGMAAAAIQFGHELASAQQEADYDELSGMYSRGGFLRSAAREITLHPERQYGFMLLDLGNFKVVNDTYGHKVGDAVIITLAHQLRHNDIAAGRMGIRSDEIGVLLNLDDIREEDTQLSYAERLEAAVERLHMIGGLMREQYPFLAECQFYVGAGTYLPSDSERLVMDARDLILHSLYAADGALYIDKEEQRNLLGFQRSPKRY